MNPWNKNQFKITADSIRVEINVIKRQDKAYGWLVLAVAFVTIFIGYAMRNTFAVFYPAIVKEFGWERGSSALMFSIAVLAYGLAAPAAGGLVDRFNPRLVLPMGACIMGGGIALCSLATNLWQFYILYGVIGAVGLSMIGGTPISAIVSNWFAHNRGLAFGILNAGFGVSLISASIAQFIISEFGWRNAYIIMGLASIAIIAPLCGIFMHHSPQEKGPFPDRRASTSPRLQAPDEPLRTDSLDSKWTLSRVLKTRRFWLLLLIGFFVLGLAEQIVVAHLAYFFQDLGYQPMEAAIIYTVFGAAFVVGEICSFLSDRLGRRKIFISCCLISAGAISLLFFIKDTTQPSMIFLFAICLGLAMGPTAPVLLATVADLFHGRHFGSIMGAIILGCCAGGAIFSWLAGFLYDKTTSYSLTLVIVMLSFIVSGVLMWIVAPRKAKPISVET